jgi:hypothetical protein
VDSDYSETPVSAPARRAWAEKLTLRAIQAGTGRPSRREYKGTRLDFGAWLGREPRPAERVALSRALSRLEKRGWVLRLPGRRAVLTKAGVAAAEAGEEGSRPEPALSLTPAAQRGCGEPGRASCPAGQELAPTAQRGANGAPACAAPGAAGR